MCVRVIHERQYLTRRAVVRINQSRESYPLLYLACNSLTPTANRKTGLKMVDQAASKASQRLLLFQLLLIATVRLAQCQQPIEAVAETGAATSTSGSGATLQTSPGVTLRQSSTLEPANNDSRVASSQNQTEMESFASSPAPKPKIIADPEGARPELMPSFGPPNNHFDGLNDDEKQDGSDLNFSLMNAPQERLLAVKDLLSSQRSMETDALGSQISSTQVNPSFSSLQCTHKGRQYAHGQNVLIEDQPCLNCTCRRAILQCYLRVCPPIVSLEAHRKMQLASVDNLSQHECKIVKEANQCCPSVKCESMSAHRQQQVLTGSDPGATNFTNSIAISLDNLAPGQMLSVTPASGESSTLRNVAAELTANSEQELLRNQQVSASNRSVDDYAIPTLPTSAVASNAPSDSRLKTPVGPTDGPVESRERDSILLITSNPTVGGTGSGGKHQSGTRESHPLGARTNSSSSGEIRPETSSSLLDTLLETVYSSAAQVNGVNLQGSCMINGSLYIEGSAVLPEGNAYCQYCYCIRQKIMCVKPKCHLYISGCTPKYSNEYACCPTSYSCTSTTNSYMSSAYVDQSYSGRVPSRMQSSALPEGRSSALSSKISAALETLLRLTKVTALPPTSSEVVSARQVDGNSASLMSLLNKPEAPKSSDELAPMTSAKVDPASTTTRPPATTTVATSTTTTVAPTKATESEEESDADDEDAEGEQSDDEKKKPREEGSDGAKDVGNPANAQTSTTNQPGSVSDFLEPMQKLGPLVMSSAVPSGCTENGRSYAIGEQIPTLESCRHCYCGIEGVKECKMIECSLKTAHNCKPIVPEGHCCPVRYECPPSGASQRSLDSRSRLVEKSKSEMNFKEATQCKTDGQSAEGCLVDAQGGQVANEQQSRPSGPPSDFTLENIRGLSEAGAPIVETTRLVDEQNSTTKSEQEHAMKSLTDELNRFIMQINRNSSSANQNQPAYLLGNNELNLQSNNGSSGSSDQTRALRAAISDYHSVQAPPSDDLTLPPAGVIGIPSIEPETVTYSVNQSERLPMSMVEYATPMMQPVVGSSRDSRSTNAQSMSPGSQVITDNHRGRARLADVILAPNQDQAVSSRGFDLAEPFNVTDEYLDQSNNSTIFPPHHQERPQIRLLRNNSSQAIGQPASEGPTTVVFDDELSNLDHSSHGNVTALVFPTNSHQNSTYLLLRQNSIHTDGIRGGSSAAFDELDRLTRNSTLEDTNNPESSSPSPPQPTTGTPIGLEADRTRETSGWLKSLTGFVQSFGRRITGSGTGNGNFNELQGAASARGTNTEGLVPPAEVRDESTGRSRKTSMVNMLKSMIGVDEGGLVMRPLASVMQVEPIEPSSKNNETRSILSPYETGSISSDSSNVEIVTAPSTSESEDISYSDKLSMASDSTNKFQRRSDIEDTLDISNSDEAEPSNLNLATRKNSPRVPLAKSLTLCYDAPTNRTYQPNEIIPKDDPCKTCTCILGEELCQNLVCPKKPSEDCREERRAGECCANYICTGSQGGSALSAKLLLNPQRSEPPVAQQTSQRARMHVEHTVPLIPERMPLIIQANLALRPVDQHSSQPRTQSSSGYSSPQRASPPLPNQPIRTSELVNLLPGHLRFRPNGMTSNFQLNPIPKFESNRMGTFLNNQPREQSPSSLNGNQIMSSNPGPAVQMSPIPVRMNSIAHPQRHPVLSPTQGYNTNAMAHNPAYGSNQIRRTSVDEPLGLSSSGWRQGSNQLRPSLVEPAAAFSSSASASPSPSPSPMRINFTSKPVGPSESPQPSFMPIAVTQGSTDHLNSGSWNPSVSILHFQQPIASTVLDRASSSSSITESSLFRQSLGSSPPMAQPISTSINEIASNEHSRVHFQQSDSLPDQAASTQLSQDTGFKPVVPLTKTTQKSSHDVDLDWKTQTQSPATTKSDEHPGSTTDNSLTSITVVTSENPSAGSTSTSDSTTPTDERSTTTLIDLSSSLTTNHSTIESSSTSPAAPITTMATESSKVDFETTQVTSAAPSSSTESATSKDESSTDFDPLSIFRVSECNIYGRLYKVGELIQELSNSCERCSCNRSGVDCQTLC